MRKYVDKLFPKRLTEEDYEEIKNNSNAKFSILKSLFLYLKSIGIILNKYSNLFYYDIGISVKLHQIKQLTISKIMNLKR